MSLKLENSFLSLAFSKLLIFNERLDEAFHSYFILNREGTNFPARV